VPSQICHILFADECLRLAGETGGSRPFFYFAAQGPDFFFHNGFSRPSGRTFGSQLHRRQIGALVRRMAGRLRDAPDERLKAFVMGFATHAFLDRAAHPFIDYFAGWEDPSDPGTRKYYRCHAFYERIIDVEFLRERRGLTPGELAPARLMDCGARLPEAVAGALGDALRATFGGLDMTADAEARVQNAYRDAMGFYEFTLRPEFRVHAAARDRSGPDRRRLALFHPEAVPAGIDFLNAGHRRWVHPCDESRVSRASFGELFDGAVAPAAEALAAVAAAAAGGPLEPIEALVGNGSLNTESPATGRRRFCEPLPLPELLDGLYREL
jgi:hypothetical protein